MAIPYFRYYFFLLIFFFLIGSEQGYAQPRFKFGIEVGPTISIAHLKEDYSTTPVQLRLLPSYGISAGFLFHYELQTGRHDNIALRTGIKFSFLTYKSKLIDGGREISTIGLLTPYEIPLIISLKARLAEKFYLREFFGISAMYINTFTGSVRDTLAPLNGEGPAYYHYQTDVPNEFTMSIISGIVFEIEMRNGNFFDFGISYNQGFSDIMVGKILLSKTQPNTNHQFEFNTVGSYLSFNLIYFFQNIPFCPEFN